MTHVEVISTMGTEVSVDVRTTASRLVLGQAMEEVTARLQAIDESFSPWRAGSWVSRLISGRVQSADCPLEVQHVVEVSMLLMDVTEGFFSPFWRYRPYGDPGPDPTGLVKGWAAQQASDVLVAHDLGDHVVNAAGDLVVSGQSTPGDPASTWRIGISDPHRARALAGVVELDQSASRWAVATSGTAELGTHVSDPHTGRFMSSVASATVVARLDSNKEGAAAADACATALIAAGPAAPALLESLAGHGIDAMVIDPAGSACDPRELLVRLHRSL
jgi:thiamine biosynthesis lipoprotein